MARLPPQFVAHESDAPLMPVFQPTLGNNGIQGMVDGARRDSILEERMTDNITPAQALIYAMFTTSAADNSMNEAEMRRIGSIVRNLPAFRHYDENDLVDEAKRWGQIASGPDGLTTVLDLIGSAVPDNLRETTYILAAEVAASDLSSRPEERRFMQLLAQRLKLDRLTVAALERAAVARHQQILDS